MKRRLFIWGLALLTVMNVAALATFGYHRFGGRSARGEYRYTHGASLKERLDLSAAQDKRMEEMRTALSEQLKPLRSALSEKRERFFQFMMADTPDRVQIDRIRSEMDSLQIEIKKLVIDHMLAQKEILTPEQQHRYFSMMRNRYSGSHGGSYRRR